MDKDELYDGGGCAGTETLMYNSLVGATKLTAVEYETISIPSYYNTHYSKKSIEIYISAGDGTFGQTAGENLTWLLRSGPSGYRSNPYPTKSLTSSLTHNLIPFNANYDDPTSGNEAYVDDITETDLPGFQLNKQHSNPLNMRMSFAKTHNNDLQV
jgi:hypothetical protein